jgi:hypothetical protein
MSDAQALLDQIITERGGRIAFDATALGVARRLANILASDSDGSAVAIAQLCELLPAKPSDTEPEYDLSKLTDAEFATFDRLSRKACGLLPPSVEKVRRKPLRSYRGLYVEQTVLLLDQIEGEALNRQRRGERVDLSDDDVLLIRGALEWLLVSLPTTPGEVFRYLIENAQYEVRKEFADREGAARAAVAAAPVVPAVDPAPEPKPSNVVTPPMWGVVIGKRNVAGERSEARSGVDLPRGVW